MVTMKGPVPCGHCGNCRVNRQRAWACRILMEAQCHSETAFITLTYEDAPEELKPSDLTLFLKRLRKHWKEKIRYFAVGEYGDQKARPHYHAALFGFPVDDISENVIRATWGLGFITISSIIPARAMYLAHYTTKKMTKKGDSRLRGKHPEFARMSRRPGLGTPFLEYVADRHRSDAGSKVVADTGDIIREVRIDGKRWPLDYYTQQKLRGMLDIPTKACERPAKEIPRATEAELQHAAQVETRNYIRSGNRTL